MVYTGSRKLSTALLVAMVFAYVYASPTELSFGQTYKEIVVPPAENGIVPRKEFTVGEFIVWGGTTVSTGYLSSVICPAVIATPAAWACLATAGVTVLGALVGYWKVIWGRSLETIPGIEGIVYNFNFEGNGVYEQIPSLYKRSVEEGELDLGDADALGKFYQLTFQSTPYPEYLAKRDGHPKAYHRLTATPKVSSNLTTRGEEDGTAADTAVSYFWNDMDPGAERETGYTGGEQMMRGFEGFLNEGGNDSKGTFLYGITRYGTQADCGYMFVHDPGYPFHGGETDGYMQMHCGQHYL